MSETEELASRIDRALAGNQARYGDKLAEQKKLPVRERLALLLDAGTLVEDGLLANTDPELPADGVVTGIGRVDGRQVCVVANDPTVKAGSWGARTVEKIVRTTEHAIRHELPIFWLVDSAGARITDQVEMFPGRRGAGRIFANQVKLSGVAPQICCLFGPSAAGGAYIPSFCDVVIMVQGNASMYLGSPRMAEEVIGEHVTLEEMGGARMHATVSGCGDNLADDDADAIEQARLLFSYLPASWRQLPPGAAAEGPLRSLTRAELPEDDAAGYDMRGVIDCIVDADSLLEIKPLFATEILTGLARLDGHVVGIVASNPANKGGVLFVDSADKAARFIWMCDAYNVPLLFLADVPGFMIGTQVERQGIIRHGAKMVAAVTEASVPKISVIVRKAYGAGLYAMCGPAFDPIATLALPTAKIAVMGPEAAVNAVYANRIAAIEDEAERAS
jgi:acetyl-CoA carboxylase carboxyltransferase component